MTRPSPRTLPRHYHLYRAERLRIWAKLPRNACVLGIDVYTIASRSGSTCSN